jgi:myo-inositol-1(or 4)-monophosphatase
MEPDLLKSQASVIKHAESLGEGMQLAMRATLAAARVIAEGYGQVHKMQSKGVGDLVSIVDQKADVAATDALADDPEKLPILSEEMSPDTDSVDADMWIIDPLDATSAFLLNAGKHYSSVLVARRRGQQTDLGICYFPLTGECFYAVRGQGAYKDGKRVQVDSSQFVGIRNAWVDMNQYGDSRLETPFFATLRYRLRTEDGACLVTSYLPNSGQACRMAEHRNAPHLTIHDNNPSSVKQDAWDIAAPQLIMEEAGGVFLSHDGGAVSPFLAEPFLVSASAALAEEVLKLAHKEV